jgi:hypothetical protein
MYDLITTVLGKRACATTWDVEVVPDRNIDQDDVEEEGFTKRLRYGYTIYQSVQHGRFDEFITAS